MGDSGEAAPRPAQGSSWPTRNERLRGNVESLSAEWQDTMLIECDVSSDDNIAEAFRHIGGEMNQLDVVVHSIAFANRDDLGGSFVRTGREGFRLALDVSAYSLIPIARNATELMKEHGGSLVAMTFLAAERVFRGTTSWDGQGRAGERGPAAGLRPGRARPSGSTRSRPAPSTHSPRG